MMQYNHSQRKNCRYPVHSPVSERSYRCEQCFACRRWRWIRTGEEKENLMSEQLRTLGIITVGLVLVTVGLGIWLGVSGKPYAIGIFTVHKLAGLGAAVLSAVIVCNMMRDFSVTGYAIALVAIAILAVVALFVTGAFLSRDSSKLFILKAIHIIAGVLGVGAASGTICMLISKLQ